MFFNFNEYKYNFTQFELDRLHQSIKKGDVEAAKMSLFTLVRSYMRFFHLFGQSLYPLEYRSRDERSKWHRIKVIIPSMFMFLVNLALCVAGLLVVNHGSKSIVKSDYVSVNVLFFCNLIKTFAVLHQNFAYDDLLGEILRKFYSIELFFRDNLRNPILFTSFKRAYVKKLFWIFGSFAILSITIAFRHIIHGLDTIDVILDAMKLFLIIAYMQIVLFIDLVAFCLKHLNATIAREISYWGAENGYVFVVKELRTLDMIRHQLCKYKIVHFRLWKIAEQLNEYFGWTMLTIILLSFVDLVTITLWQLRVLNEPWNFIGFIRKELC